MAAYSQLPANDPWGSAYQWHNPGCCIDECTMVLSPGSNKVMCAVGNVNCEHLPAGTANCVRPNSSYDDLGYYFGRVRNHQ